MSWYEVGAGAGGARLESSPSWRIGAGGSSSDQARRCLAGVRASGARGPGRRCSLRESPWHVARAHGFWRLLYRTSLAAGVVAVRIGSTWTMFHARGPPGTLLHGGELQLNNCNSGHGPAYPPLRRSLNRAGSAVAPQVKDDLRVGRELPWLLVVCRLDRAHSGHAATMDSGRTG